MDVVIFVMLLFLSFIVGLLYLQHQTITDSILEIEKSVSKIKSGIKKGVKK